MTDERAFLEEIEPEAKALTFSHTTDLIVQVSLAISMKRIADVLELAAKEKL